MTLGGAYADPQPPPGLPPGRRAILASGMWVAASTLVPFLATAGLSVVAGRVLGPELLGQQSLVAFTGTLLSALLLTSLTDASIRSLSAAHASHPAGLAALQRWSLWAHLSAGAAVAAVLIGVGLLRGQLAAAWLAMAATVALDALCWAWSSRSIARDGWAPVARRRLVTQILAVVLGIAALLGGLGVAGIFLAAAAASAVLLLLLRSEARSTRAPRGPGLPRQGMRRLWLVFAAGAALAQIVSGRLEILFLGAYQSGTAIAHYSVAAMLVTAAVTLPAALAGAAMPAVAAASGTGDTARSQEAFVRAMRVTVLLSLPLTALIVTVGPAVVLAVYGEAFAEAADLTRVIGLGAVLIPAGRLATSYWSGRGLLRLPIAAGLVGAVVEISLALALIPRFSASGAVVTTLAAQGAAAVVLVALTWRSLGRAPLDPRGWCAGAAASGLAGVSGAAAVAAGGLPGVLAGGAATVLVFAAAAWALGLVGMPLLDTADAAWLAGALPLRLGVLVRPLTRAVRAAEEPRRL